MIALAYLVEDVADFMCPTSLNGFTGVDSMARGQ